MRIKHCVGCGGILDKRSDTQYACAVCGQDYWNNPHTAASVIIHEEGKILFTERAEEPHKGGFDLPGGFLDYDEDAEAAARREIKEELGVGLGSLQLIGSYTHEYAPGVSSCELMFLARGWKGTFKPADDVAGYSWRDVDFLDDSKCAWHYPGLKNKLRNLLENTNGGR
jgi:ADP-ribose pyrophosphatase YjhB (NUDIX family)